MMRVTDAAWISNQPRPPGSGCRRISLLIRQVSSVFAVIALLTCCLPACAQAGLDTKWIAFDRAGAPNSKWQCFAPQNISVSGGHLVIATRTETAKCSSFDLQPATYKYTSGFVSMRRFNFLYGTVEFRAKFGGGSNSGAWPAVWLSDVSCQSSDPTGTDERCNGQEIDVAEILDANFTQVNQQIHVNDLVHNDGCTASTSDASQNFHVYQLVWSPGLLVFGIDGATTCTIAKKFVPNAPMYLKVSMYVGGYGGPVKESSLPWTTLIDYVKVTQESTVVFEDDFNSKDQPVRTDKKPKPGKAR
jgi:beta-glucanase (GH16 family)